jgi:hypothetical protein
MKQSLLIAWMGLLILSACAPAVPVTGNENMPTADAQIVTATPGSMTANDPEAAHMMEPITAPNVQPATETEGGQPLEFREKNGVKVFELTTKAVQWTILDG